MHRGISPLAFLVVVLVLGHALPSLAAPSPEPGTWQFDGVVYGWLPNISGSVGFGVQGEEKPFTVDLGAILDNLRLTVQVGLEAQRDDWSILANAVYLDVGNAKSATSTLPDGSELTTTLDLDLRTWIVDVDGAYTVQQSVRNRTQLLFGIRYLSMKSTVDIDKSAEALPGQHLEARADLLDGIVGVRGRFSLGGRWTIPYRVDLGAGGSEFTWQGQAGIDYAWSWGGALLLYRYLFVDQGEDKAMQELEVAGPLGGLRFRF